MSVVITSSFFSVFITVIAHIFGRWLNIRLPSVTLALCSFMFISVFLLLAQLPYDVYLAHAKPVFDHLLGYVTVAFAIPLATIKTKDFPLLKYLPTLIIASVIAAVMPMGLAVVWGLNQDTVLAFATRAVTTPIALNISDIIHSPPVLASIIIIISGLIGAAFADLFFKHIKDERVKGLTLGIVAHALGMAHAYQKSPVMGQYATFGMAVNGIITAIWLPFFIHWIYLP